MLRVTHFSDPGCPFAYSALPAITALQWRYGDQLGWRLVLIGLTEEAAQYAARGYTPLKSARAHRRFARHGMPFARAPKPRMAATARACRLVIAARRTAPELAWPLFRALQFTQFTTPLPFDDDRALRDAVARVPGLYAGPLLDLLDAPEVTEAYERDRAEARTAAGTPTEFQGKAAATDGPVRYTAPSLVFTAEDGRSLEAGGFQPLEVYDALIANLDTSLTRRPAPADLAELLDAFPHGLTTREVSTVLADPNDAPDDDAAEHALLELAASGRALAEPLGDGTLWVAAGSPLARRAEDRESRLAAPVPR
jgi:2-hydroxychromene-2-carboxylate isomerase